VKSVSWSPGTVCSRHTTRAPRPKSRWALPLR
jgi:hypothetical protein